MTTSQGEGGGDGDALHLSEKSIADIINKMHVLNGVLKKDFGVTERAAVITPPLSTATNSRSFAHRLTKEFKTNVRLLQDVVVTRQAAVDARDGLPSRSPLTPQRRGEDVSKEELDKAMAILGFEAYAAISQTQNKQRLLLLVEDSVTGKLSLVCSGHSSTTTIDVDTNSLEEETRLQNMAVEELRHFSLPLNTFEAHRMLLTLCQRRDYLGQLQSPNPVTRSEFNDLVKHLRNILTSTVPYWALDRIAAGGVFCGTSHNGGLLNVAARVAGHVVVTVDKVEVPALYSYCGQTDVLLGANYPHPQLILPQAALTSALLQALRCPRAEYCPTVSLAAGILTDRSYWTDSARLSKISQEKFFRNALHRTFPRPKRSEDKSAPLGSSAKQVFSPSVRMGFRQRE